MQEVPCPVAPPGGVLVRTTHSVISIGTEKMKVEQAKMNLLQKAKARPDQVRKVLETARNLGWKSAYEKVRNRLSSPTPLGYSAAGVVEAVDEGNSRFRMGDRVACGGAARTPACSAAAGDPKPPKPICGLRRRRPSA